MQFTQSLKKTIQFRRVYGRKRSVANRFLVLYVLRNGSDKNKLGISVSKKVGKSVIRSRVTRLIRESYRLLEYRVKFGYDLVFVARHSAAEASFKDISRSMEQLLIKHDLLLM